MPQQLDLFSTPRQFAGRTAPPPETPPAAPAELADETLLAALGDASPGYACAVAEEIGRRQPSGAVAALERFCRRFARDDADKAIPEQITALEGLARIGSGPAREAVARLISRPDVGGANLVRAAAVAVVLACRLEEKVVLALLERPEPELRADACRLVRHWPSAIPGLLNLLGDRHRQVSEAAACALGRLGQREALPWLKRFLRERPGIALVEAVGGVGDDECAILLAAIARAQPALRAAALDALEMVDTPRSRSLSERLELEFSAGTGPTSCP